MSNGTYEHLIQQAEEQRRFWLTLTEEPTRKVQVCRPTEVQVAILLSTSGMERYQAYADLVVDWKGFSASDLGSESTDRLPFVRAAWNAIWQDRLEWLVAVAEAADNAFAAYRTKKAEAAKN